ncbi:hypothetical protein IGI04_026021 [Brassica rapa subsp. trilocularis]|uniref:Putative plant transposon protein domain-containing protein n=1 Tax=Brassica rapa subsp. trilocularis TaxID=1813537 RepID=A0ABQ7KXW1_BRACM|nr:hypothetical protein IGI04_026021 [Brassica rapa subsp. trilocularis]
MSSESSGSNRRRNREFHSGSPHRLEPSPYMSFESRLKTTRLFFVSNAPVPNPRSLRHLDDPAVCEARRILEDSGWIYTVLHVRPFCPKVGRECVLNLYSADDGVYIRGCRFDFDPVVINQLFMTPNVEHSHVWETDDLSEAIIRLTVWRCRRWETFSLTYLLPQYDYLYKLCSLNWLPGSDDDSMIKRHLRFLFAIVRKKPIDFGRLVYNQVLKMSRSCDDDTKITLPNLIYQTLIL